MAKQTLLIKDFSGGISDNEKKWLPNSLRLLKNANIFEDPTYITLNPKTTKVSGSTVDDLVKWAVDGTPHDTNRYFYADNGKIFRETSAGVWSSLRTVTASSGNGLLVFDDYLYYPLDANLGRYGLLSGTPAFNDSFLEDGTTNLDQSLDTSGNTYTTPTSISEAATARQTFVPTKDPVKTIQVLVAAKGSGDWTVTLHDAGNRSIATKTITAASMATGDVDFTFATPGRIVIDNSYHFHVTSTVADGTVTTTTASDLETVDYHEFFGILVTDTNYHPMIDHLNSVIIGNERYLAHWDQATYDPNKIVFEPGFNARALTKEDEFVVAACWRSTDIEGFEEGRLYYWDGSAPTFNLSKAVTAGLPNAVTNSKGRLFSILGSRGTTYLGSEPFTKIQEAPNLKRGGKVEVRPGAATEWEGKTLIGYGGSDDSGFQAGVYQYGSQSGKMTEVLSHGFTISTGTVNDNVEIGCVQAFGDDLYIGWKDSTTYGVDKITKGDTAFATGIVEGLVFDNDNPDNDLLPFYLTITFESLATNESVTPKYKLDRGSYTTGTAVTSGTRAEERIFKRCKEMEFGFNFASTDGTYPKITAIELEFDDLKEERGG